MGEGEERSDKMKKCRRGANDVLNSKRFKQKKIRKKDSKTIFLRWILFSSQLNAPQKSRFLGLKQATRTTEMIQLPSGDYGNNIKNEK